MRYAALAAVVILLAPSAEARSSKGEGPRTMVAAYGAVWVGFGDGRVARVDPGTDRVREVLARGAFVYSMAAGYGGIWLTSSRSPAAAPTVHRLDPRGGHVRTIRVGGWPSLVAVGAGAVWVTDSARNMILRLDPRTGRTTARMPLPGRLWGIPAAGARDVWLQTVARGPVTGPAGRRVVWRLGPDSFRPRRAFTRNCDTTLLPSGRRVWMLDNCDGTLARFDPETSSWTEPIRTGRWASPMARGFGAIWISDAAIAGGATVYRVDPQREVVTARIRAKAASIASGENAVWILDGGDGTTGWLRRIDPATNRLVGRRIRLSARQ